jgi:hypothetical protein
MSMRTEANTICNIQKSRVQKCNETESDALDTLTLPDPWFKKERIAHSLESEKISLFSSFPVRHFSNHHRYKLCSTTSPEINAYHNILSIAHHILLTPTINSVNFVIISVYSDERRIFKFVNQLDNHILAAVKFSGYIQKSQVISPL